MSRSNAPEACSKLTPCQDNPLGASTARLQASEALPDDPTPEQSQLSASQVGGGSVPQGVVPAEPAGPVGLVPR